MPSVPVEEGRPYRGFNFKVEVDGVEVGGFQRASGLTVQMETVEYREGGVDEFVHQLPGQFSHSNLVLEKGLTNKTVFWDWIQDVKSGEMDKRNARKNLRVKIVSAYKQKNMWGWEFHNAYPVQWNGPQLQGGAAAGNVAVQSIEFAHEGFVKLSGTP